MQTFSNRLTTPRVKPTLYTENVTVQRISHRTREVNLEHSKRMSKLSDQQVREIRELRLDGMTIGELCWHYDVTPGTICRILNGTSYTWVK